MRVAQLTPKNAVCTVATVVWALRTGETRFGPAKRVAVQVEKSVLLLDSEPRLLIGNFVHDFDRVRASVAGNRLTLWRVALAHHQQVIASTERILVHRDRLEKYLRVIAWRLHRGRPVKVPHRQIINRSWLGIQDSSLGSNICRVQALRVPALGLSSEPTQPNILRNHLVSNIQLLVLIFHRLLKHRPVQRHRHGRISVTSNQSSPFAYTYLSLS
mmetsp:Transcript_809/g.1539  ORF Transcript_809/g.1539 Transcript_809/m.1539 type:complete len:215 (-) Transcript_809:5-649(-)